MRYKRAGWRKDNVRRNYEAAPVDTRLELWATNLEPSVTSSRSLQYHSKRTPWFKLNVKFSF